MTGLEIAKLCREVLEEKKGQEVVILEVGPLSMVTDYFVIASGNNTPHLRALQEAVRARLKAEGIRVYRESGAPDGVWFCLDFVDVVVHLLHEDARRYYDLESLWAEAERIS